MPAKFSLTGLLRLRGIQQDQAAGALAVANREVQAVNERRSSAAQRLAGSASTPANAEALMTIAATRASARSMFLELDGAMTLAKARAESARENFAKAKSDTAALEKLAERHREASAEEDLRTEQNALDEISSTRPTPVTGIRA